jgi:CBS domain-containing protein
MPDRLDSPVSEIMATQIEMVAETIPMSFAARLLAEKHIQGLPVTTEEGELIGVLSWSDVLSALGDKPVPAILSDDGFYGPGAPTLLLGTVAPLDTLTGVVRDHMSRQLIAVDVSATVRQAASVMSRGGVHRVLVVDRLGNLAGLVSAIDIVRHVAA